MTNIKYGWVTVSPTWPDRKHFVKFVAIFTHNDNFKSNKITRSDGQILTVFMGEKGAKSK